MNRQPFDKSGDLRPGARIQDPAPEAAERSTAGYARGAPRILVFVIVFSLLLAGCGLARKPKLVPLPAPGKMPTGEAVSQTASAADLLQVGEELEYQVRWLGIEVGRAILAVKARAVWQNKPVYHILMTVETRGFFSLFFRVDGFVESYVDAGTGTPVYYNSETNINRKFVFKRMWYDFPAGKVRAEDRKGVYELELSPDTLDPLGIFYYFRKRPLVLDEPISLVINGGKRNFPVTIYARRERRIHVPEGSFLAFLVEPTTQSERQFDDIINAAGSMRIWFSADERHIPLMITLQVPLGTAVAALSRVRFPAPSIDAIASAVVEYAPSATTAEAAGGHSL